MADNIVGNLFGIDLDALQKAKDAAATAENYKIAQLDPYQAQRFYMGEAGRGLGKAIGGLFGIQDPEIAKQASRNQMLQKIQRELTPEDLKDPEKLATAVFQAANEAGDMEMANQAYQGLQQARLQNAKVAQEQSQTNKANMEANLKLFDYQQQQKATEALSKLWEAKKNEGTVPTNEEIISVAAQYMSPEKLAPMLVSSSDKALYRGMMQQQIDNAKELGLARIAEIKDKDIRDNQTKLLIANIQAQQKQLDRLTKDSNPEYKTYGSLAEKLNDDNYGVAQGKIPAREQTIARRIGTDSREVTTSIEQLNTLTAGGKRDIAGTVFANVKDDGFFSATGKALANSVNPKESAMYDAIMYPLVKGIALLNNPDYRPNQADVINAMKSYKANAGESHIIQLQKMAELRKNYEAAAEAQLDAHILNAAQAKSVRDNVKKVQSLIPWNVDDVIKYAGDKSAQTTPFNKWLEKGSKSSDSKYVVGKTYTDASGNKAIYQADGTWKEVK